MNELTKEVASLFESLRHIDENGVEYWSAREIYTHLGYTKWANFLTVIEKAKESCKNASGDILSDFASVGKIVKAGAMEKTIEDILLTRYACYLVAQNGDPRKPEIAQAQTYFAIQTRYAEIQQMEAYQELTTEESKRLFLREQLRAHNSRLADAAHAAHHEVGKEVREAIKRIGGTMPEDLPSVESIKTIESKKRKLLKASEQKLRIDHKNNNHS